MARTRIITVKPPLGGVVRSSGFQSQEPYTCSGATNMWGVDAKTGRKRLATRPRLTTYSSDITDTGGLSSYVIRGIGQVNSVLTSGGGAQPLVRGLFVFADGKLWRMTAAGTFGASYGSGYSTTRYISSTAYLQKLFYTGDTGLSEFDCSDNTVDDSPSATAGSLPTNCTIVAEWAGRLVLSGQTTIPHAVYMSRIGDPLDFDYAETDVSAAVDFTAMDGGLLGERVTALISHNRECLIIGATDSMHIMRGNPLEGGRLEIISHTVGPLSHTAWCKTGDDATVILTRNGLYVMAPGCGSAPVPFSNKRIPDSLMGINTSTYDVHLAYDTRFNGIHIYLTGSVSSEAWWCDWETGAFWPMELETGQKPYAVLRFDPLDAANTSGVLVGGADGTLRQFNRLGEDTMTTCNAYLGPIKLSSSPLEKSIIQKMHCAFGSNATDTSGTISIYCAENGDAAYAAAVANDLHHRFQITMANQTNNLIAYPRVGGHAAVIKMAMGVTSAHLCLEEIVLQVMDAGVMR